MKKEIVHVPTISDTEAEANVPLSAAVKAGGFVFVSGLPPINPETGVIERADIKRQTELSLDNLKATLEAAGSSLDKVVKATVYISNAAYFDTVNDIYRRYFPHDPPARTFVTVGSWPWPFDIEVDCIAIA